MTCSNQVSFLSFHGGRETFMGTHRDLDLVLNVSVGLEIQAVVKQPVVFMTGTCDVDGGILRASIRWKSQCCSSTRQLWLRQFKIGFLLCAPLRQTSESSSEYLSSRFPHSGY